MFVPPEPQLDGENTKPRILKFVVLRKSRKTVLFLHLKSFQIYFCGKVAHDELLFGVT